METFFSPPHTQTTRRAFHVFYHINHFHWIHTKYKTKIKKYLSINSRETAKISKFDVNRINIENEKRENERRREREREKKRLKSKIISFFERNGEYRKYFVIGLPFGLCAVPYGYQQIGSEYRSIFHSIQQKITCRKTLLAKTLKLVVLCCFHSWDFNAN